MILLQGEFIHKAVIHYGDILKAIIISILEKLLREFGRYCVFIDKF